MKPNYLLLSVFLLNLASLKTIAQNTDGQSNKPAPVATSNTLTSILDKQVDSVARQYIQKSNTVGLSIGILVNGAIKTYGYGEIVKGEGNLPDANTIFEIGSITKTFTASILAYYVNQGKISLTDPITKYLPDSLLVNPELNSIKIINLSNHTSGLPSIPPNFLPNMDPLNPYLHYDEALLFANLKTCKLATIPGEVYAYSNLSVGLLGVILQRVSGKNYEQLVKQVITGPLKMSNTAQILTPKATKQFTAVYNAKGTETKPWDFKALAACGCLRSTVNDLLTYAKNNIHCDNTVLSNAFDLTHQITFSKEPLVGLGWHVFQIKGANYYWHNGGTGGSRSFLIFSIEQKMAAVVLSNAEVGVDEVGLGIFKKMLGK
ncbi:MAG: serine hydrolase domain-containing protein [Bacteroidota bacterium]